MMTRYKSGRRTGVLERTTAPASEPVTLAEVKSFLRVTLNTEDSVITRLIASAREAAELYLKRSLITQQWTLWCDEFVPTIVYLPMSPVQSIASVTIIAKDLTETIISSNGYRLNAGKRHICFDTPVLGHAVEIVYLAGYGDSVSDVPEAITQGIMHHVANMFENRADSGIPRTALSLYTPYRIIEV